MRHEKDTAWTRPSRPAEPRAERGQQVKLAARWTAWLASAAAGAALLQVFAASTAAFANKSPGPRAFDLAVADDHGFRPLGAPPARSAAANLDTLLTGAETEIADSDGEVPLNGTVARTLGRVAAALPSGSIEQRAHASALAKQLFNRAKVALAAGKVDEEQHWLALGAILAPPPSLRPSPTERLDQPPASPPAKQPVAVPSPADRVAAREAPPAAARRGAAPTKLAAADTANAPGSSPPQAPSSGQTTATARMVRPAPAAATAASPAQLAPAPPPDRPPSGTGSSGIGYSVRFAAGSPQARQNAEVLASRFGAKIDAAGPVESGASHTAIIRYAGEGGHAAAREAARALGGMGYPWRLERLSANADAASATVQVWLPADRAVARKRRPVVAGQQRRPFAPAPGEGWAPPPEPAPADATPASVWQSRPTATTAYPSWRPLPPEASWAPPLPYYWGPPPPRYPWP